MEGTVEGWGREGGGEREREGERGREREGERGREREGERGREREEHVQSSANGGGTCTRQRVPSKQGTELVLLE